MAGSEEVFVTSSALPSLDPARLMVEVQRQYGVGIGRQTFDMIRLKRRRTALTPYEYFYYGLYDPKRSWLERDAYVGQRRAQSVYLLANHFTWWNAAEDKLAFHAAMQAQGYPTPTLLALAHSERRFGGVANLRTRAELVDWLRTAPTPLFGKPLIASHGQGGVMIQAIDGKAGTFVTDAGRSYRLEVLAAAAQRYVDGDGYVFQEALRPCAEVARLTDGRLATLRIVLLLDRAGPAVFQIIARLPSGENRVDNFRRPGNLICSVDPETGAVGPVVRGVGLERETLDAHPDTGVAFAGLRLPLVREAMDLARRAGSGFPGLHVQSWDIALCDDGVRALEMNPGGNLNLLQLSLDRGVWTPEFQEFVRWCAGLELNTQVRGRDVAMKLAA
ncbi:MAG: sugar-transfer associated ATP-grasp domain-containing protein [Pseudomonadota bacterium]